MNALRWTFSAQRAWAVTVLGMLTYAVAYLLVARALIVDPHGGFARVGQLPLFQAAADLSWGHLGRWLDPVFVLYLTDAIVLAPPAPILATAVVLGGLVGANLAVTVETLVRRPPSCDRRGAAGLAAALPSFLASMSCCAPTVLLLLGGGFAAAVIAVVPFVVPLAAALLVAALVWSLRSLERTAVLATGSG